MPELEWFSIDTPCVPPGRLTLLASVAGGVVLETFPLNVISPLSVSVPVPLTVAAVVAEPFPKVRSVTV